MFYRFHPFFLLAVIAAAVTIANPLPAAAAEEVALVVGGQSIFLHTKPVMVDNEIYVPFAAMNAVGADVEGDGPKVNITSAAGKKLTCPTRKIDGEPMVAIRDIAPELGVVTSWDARARSLSLRARIESIELDKDELRINTSFPVTFDDIWWKGASKLIVDINGVHIPKDQSSLTVKNSTEIPVRTGLREDGETGRVVLDLTGSVDYKVRSPHKTTNIRLSLSGAKPGKSPTDLPPDGDPQPQVPGKGISDSEPAKPPAVVTDVRYEKRSPRNVEVSVKTSEPVKYITYMTRDPEQLIVDLENAVQAKDFGDIAVGHDIVQGIRVRTKGSNATRLIMDLTRVVGFNIRQDGGAGLVIDIEVPKGAGGLLTDKTIVIDPGHGGKDTGAVGIGGWKEKDSNLAIALKLQKTLSNAGACALLTRSKDVRLGNSSKSDLEERAAFAKRHSADIFISIHSNSVAGRKCPSGLETYYHGRDSNGRALAHSVHTEILRTSGFPDRKYRSDFVLYRTGLGVLRGAAGYDIPAVLLEIGFVRNASDCAKIRDPRFQQRVADAIVKGLKAYVEGNPDPVRRSQDKDTEPSTGTVDDTESNQVSSQVNADEQSADQDDMSGKGDEKPTPINGPERPGE